MALWLDLTLCVYGQKLYIFKDYPNHLWVSGLSPTREKPTIPRWLGKGSTFLRFVRGHFANSSSLVTIVNMSPLQQFLYLLCFLFELIYLGYPMRFIHRVVMRPQTQAASVLYTFFKDSRSALVRYERARQSIASSTGGQGQWLPTPME